MPSYVLKTGAFTPQFCEKALVEMRKKVKMKPAGTLRDNNVRRDIRRSSVGWPDRADHEFIHEADKIAREINQENWKFALEGDGEYQLTHYAVEDNGVYHTHIDMDLSGDDRASERKISFVVQLSDPLDYFGGELRLEHVGTPGPAELRKRGSIIVFPSFVPHSVSPLVRGERWSLVSWLSGPPLV